MDNLLCRVLLVEANRGDYFVVRDLLASIATTEFDLQWVDTYQAARESLARHQYDVCLLDYRLGEGTGVELMQEFKDSDSKSSSIFCPNPTRQPQHNDQSLHRRKHRLETRHEQKGEVVGERVHRLVVLLARGLNVCDSF